MPSSATRHANALLTRRVITIISYVLSIYFSFKYAGGRWGNHPPTFHVNDTPFTANAIVVLVYWLFLLIGQLFYLLQFYSDDEPTLVDVTNITWHFTLFNLLHSLWIWLFSHKHKYISAEIVLIANLFNLLGLYVHHKPYAIKPLSRWITIHPSTCALPLSWVMYAIFWNGAVAFHAHRGFFSRIVANIFIWEFLLVPGLFIILFNDWAIGFSSAALVFGIGIAQLFTKIIALQWIFAFIIAGLLFLLSTIIAIPKLTPAAITKLREDTRGNGERAPLLEPNA
ncbi:uncharacterized protein SAPINGB_P000777 [Magnusiomyces paraingens]|uniref:DUF1774-domain-containing protein n=1 Tax=Magnusiomyces paraingens TaxID=2606893 RepID=A0A5E8B2S9_9ASCO|nr:uncharacterized protein SAPINGB_P000777 [Saprochaete ingens]VVT45519.1 unnamed protein product [Saprochaete ingens]